MEEDGSYPEKAVMTTTNEHERNQLEIMVDDKECIYVFNRGYLDYERFDFTRLKKNAVIREFYNFKLPENTSVLSD